MEDIKTHTAIDYDGRELTIDKDVGDRAGQERSSCNLGNVYHDLEDFKTAIEYHEHHPKSAKDVEERAEEDAYDLLGDLKTAVHIHEHHLQIAKEVRDRAGEGQAFRNLGKAYYSLGDFKTAIDYYERHLKVAKELEDRAGEVQAYCTIGNTYYRLGNFQTAIDYHERHLNGAKDLGDRTREEKAYCNLGVAYCNLGAFKTAINYFERALKIAREVGDRAGEGMLYGNLGNAYDSLGNFTAAIDYHQRHLKSAKEMEDRTGEGGVHCNLGNAFHHLGDFKAAIDCHKRHLTISKIVGDRTGEGTAYGNLGNAYDSLGDFKSSIDYFERSLKCAKEVGDRADEARAYCNLGIGYGKLGNFKTSIDYIERHLKFAIKERDRVGEGMAYGNLGATYDSLGDFKTAINYYERCLKVTKEVGDRAGEGKVCGNLGIAHRKQGDFEKAIDYHGNCLKIVKEVGDRAGEGTAYGNLGSAYSSQGHFKKAIDYHERHLKIAKEVGDRVGEAKSLHGLGYSLASQGSPQESLDYYNSSVRMWNDIRNDLHFKDEWKISFRNMYTSFWRLLLKQGKVVEALFAAEQARAQALNDLLKLSYGSEAPSFGSHIPQEATLCTLSCLSNNTVFIAIDKSQIIFWIIQNGKDVQLRRKKICNENVATFVQTLIRNACTEIGVRAGVKCEDRSLAKPGDEDITTESSELTVCHSLKFQPNALKTLYAAIIAPIADLLNDNELTFAPDGPLCLAPFAALLDSDSRYLSQHFRIRVIPSLTSLKLITDCSPDYHNNTGALLVGDPCLEEVLYRGTKLNQLPWAKKEVEMIGRILHTPPLTGKDATKGQVLRRLPTVALVHIAAHGRMETGEIALAPNTTRESKTPVEEDFVLTMQDVLSVQMRAKLVVLSCCHSGRGDVIKPEGVVGIGRAFLGAGARSVLVSLWAIDDEATQLFMKSFYQQLAKGRSASEALNQAMECMRDSDEFNQVRYWAPFVLIGDDVTLDINGGD